jgi:Ala-tRNA(Pro) deacylase
MEILELLSQHGIPYQRVDHPPVYTCEEAVRLVPSLPGVHTKNLFVRDKKGTTHVLVVVAHDKAVDLKALSSALGLTNLSLASERRLREHLGIEAGAVSILAVLNDSKGTVRVVVDRDVWRAEVLQCHPLVNTSTLAIRRGDVGRLLELTGHTPEVMAIPERG